MSFSIHWVEFWKPFKSFFSEIEFDKILCLVIFSRQNSLFQNTKEKFGGKKIYFANERGTFEFNGHLREILPMSQKFVKSKSPNLPTKLADWVNLDRFHSNPFLMFWSIGLEIRYLCEKYKKIPQIKFERNISINLFDVLFYPQKSMCLFFSLKALQWKEK
jgi:hypothetical protein